MNANNASGNASAKELTKTCAKCGRLLHYHIFEAQLMPGGSGLPRARRACANVNCPYGARLVERQLEQAGIAMVQE